MTDAFSNLNSLIAEVVDLRYAAALLGWDERVCMPPGGAAVRVAAAGFGARSPREGHGARLRSRDARAQRLCCRACTGRVRCAPGVERGFQPLDHPYDALLDIYEPGMRTSDVQVMFDALRPRQTELARGIQARTRPSDRPASNGFLHARYGETEMLGFATDVISTFGFDWTRGRQDKSAHPFAIPIGSDDVRITTRFDERRPFETLFSTMHEAGHTGA